MTIPSTPAFQSFNSDAYQAQVAYRADSQQSFRYTNSDGESVSYRSSSSLAYRLDINNQSSSQPLVYSKRSETSTSISQVSAPDPALLNGAKNILNFVEQRLAKEAGAGASTETLNELLEQGLAGFKQGFGEAEEILKSKGALDAVQETIGLMYSQVLEGFEALKQQYLEEKPTETANTAVTPAEAVVEAPAVAQPVNTVPSKPLLQFSSASREVESLNYSRISSQRFIDTLDVANPISDKASSTEEVSTPTTISTPTTTPRAPAAFENTYSSVSSVEYGRKDRFSFTLQTQDGDKVTIDALNTTVYAARYSEQVSEAKQESEWLEGLNTRNNYEFSIVGELDDDEIRAIDDLMQKIMSLADEFYNGSIDKAYEQALSVGYDANEIASYSLNMKQVEQYNVSTAYQAFTPEALEKPALNGVFDMIGDYTQSIVDLIHQPENNQTIDFSRLLKSIAEQIDEQLATNTDAGFKEAVSPFLEV